MAIVLLVEHFSAVHFRHSVTADSIDVLVTVIGIVPICPLTMCVYSKVSSGVNSHCHYIL